MAKKRGLSLAVRIIGITTILFLAIFTVLIFVISSEIRKGVSESETHNVQQASRQLKDLLEMILKNNTRRVVLAAGKAEVIEATINGDRATLESICRNSYSSDSYFDAVYIIDAEGKIMAIYPYTNEVGRDMSNEDYFFEIKNNKAGSYISKKGFKSQFSEEPVITTAAPIQKDGKLYGMLSGNISLNEFNKMYVIPQEYGEHGYAYIIDNQGTVLAHPNLPLIESSLGNEEFTKEMVNSEQKSGKVHYIWEGKWKYAFYEKFDLLPWIVVASIYDDDLLSLSVELNKLVMLISIGSMLVLVFILILSIYFFISKPMNKISVGLVTGAENLESASYQISSSSQEQSSFSSEQAASVEEISASLEEMQTVVEMNTSNIHQSELMMKETNEGSQKVTNQMSELKSALGEINDNSRQIVKIIKVIEDIAFQTNILALNAAVEAARAGDAGRGFAVVADQVKDLAQKSAEAASESALLIDKAMESVKKGEDLGEKVMEIQIKAGEMAQKVTSLLDEVNRSSQEQKRGINQITQAVVQTNQGVQQAAASSEETAAASEELLSQAEELNEMVDKMNLIIKGKVEEHQIKKKKKVVKTDAAPGKGNSGNSSPRMIASKDEGKKVSTTGDSPEQVIPLDEDFSEF